MLPKPGQLKTFAYGLIGIQLILLCACQNGHRSMPFPEKDARVIQVLAQPFSFTPAEKADWVYLDADSLKKLSVTKPFRLSDLPENNLNIAKEVPLAAPLDEKKLAWDTTVHFNIDTVPSQKYNYRISILGVPKRVRAEIPRPTDNASENILVFGQEQGLPDLSVSAILEDHTGNIWFSTINGLCVFDGVSSMLYTTEQGLSINSTNFIEQIQVWNCMI